MLKLAALLVFVIGCVNGQAFTCPPTPITAATSTGNLPTGATNVTAVPAGTNCSFVFDIPNNYVILLKFSIDFQSDDDYVYIYDNNDRHKYYMTNPGYAYYDSPLYMPARSAQVQVVGVSGNSRFFLSYEFQSLAGYQQITKNTGDAFSLSTTTDNVFYTIQASTDSDQVVPNFAQTAGASLDPYLHDIFVYDGDNINTATFLGNLDDIGSTLTVSTGRSLSFVNPYGTTSDPTAWFLGNDAFAVQGYNKYFALLATSQTIISGSLSDVTDFGAAFTFICVDCDTFYWTVMQFDMSLTASRGYISFQGQTPTHKREKLIRYDPSTYSQNYLPQILPTNTFTINLFMSRVIFNVTTTNGAANFHIPYDGRQGYIYSPSLWSSAPNSYQYEIRDDSTLFNYTLNFNNMFFQSLDDQLSVKIGTGNGAPTIDNQYPRDQFGTNVSATGNYMQIGLTASAQSDIRLSYQMSSSSASICPTTPINVTSFSGNLPIGATNITNIPAGTNCSYMFDIPNNYVILLKLSIDFQSDDDFVYIYDNYDNHKYYMLHPGYAYYDSPLFMPARSASVRIYSASGKTRFMLSYAYKSLSSYTQVTKNTGEYFPLNSVTGNTFYTITSATDQVVPNTAQTLSAPADGYLHDIFVYDGDNINTANFLGNLDSLASGLVPSTGSSISLVNVYNSAPVSYFLGNDASTVQGLNKYFTVIVNGQSTYPVSMSDTTEFGAAFTFICLDCSTFWWTQMRFDSMFTTPSRGYISFQGQTPTHRREKLIRYDPLTFDSNYLPQILPTDIFTINLFKARVIFNMTTAASVANYNQAYDGRKGYIFAPALWNSGGNNFAFDIRDDSQQFNYTLNFDKMSFPVIGDQVTVKIGPTSGTPTVDNQYPRDQFSSGLVSGNGNYMQVGLTASTGADVRLSFEISPPGTAVPTTTTTAAPTTPTPPPVTTAKVTVVTAPVATTTIPNNVATTAQSSSTAPVNPSGSPATTPVVVTPTATVQTTTKGALSKFEGVLMAIFVLLSAVL